MNRNVYFFGLLYFCAYSVWSATYVQKIRMHQQNGLTRIVFDLSQQAQYSHFTLTSPYRLVIDVSQAQLEAKVTEPLSLKQGIKGVNEFRTHAEQNKLRLVFDLDPAYVPFVFPLQPNGPYGHRLIVDLKIKAEPKLESKSKPLKLESKIIKPVNGKASMRPVVVAIDPGHGGSDPGSIGPTRVFEKHVALNIATKLKSKLEGRPGFKAVLTRDKDVYISPNQRSAIARSSHADLLVSIHADSFSSAKPRGVSVWVLSSNRANREMERWVHRQQKNDLLGGLGAAIDKVGEQRYLTRTFLELAMDKTRDSGYLLAEHLLHDLSKIAKMHKKLPQQGSLSVLKAPDIPSVLVEVGFISNPHEEKLLNQVHYQEKMASALSDGIYRFVVALPPRNSYYETVRYIVRAGDNLSSIAQRYDTTLKQLLVANQLASERIFVGQELVIPRS